MGVYTALASRHFQNDANCMPTFDFWRKLVIHCMEITIGKYPVGIGRPMWDCRSPQIVECHLYNVPNYRVKWITSEKNPSVNIISITA